MSITNSLQTPKHNFTKNISKNSCFLNHKLLTLVDITLHGRKKIRSCELLRIIQKLLQNVLEEYIMLKKQSCQTKFFLFLITIINTVQAQAADQEQPIIALSSQPIKRVEQAHITTIKPIKLEDSDLANFIVSRHGHIHQETLDPVALSKNKSFYNDKQNKIPTKKIGTKSEIEICSSLPLTPEENAQLGKQINDGMNLFFNKLKKNNVTKRLVKLYVLDNKSDFETGKSNLETLIQKSPALLNLFGSDILLSKGKELLEDKKMTAFFPVEGLDILRKPEYSNMIYLRASHEDELKALVTYSITKLNHKKFAVFYEASDWGEAVLESLKKVLDSLDFKLLADGSYPPGTVDILNAVGKISKASPNAIFCIAKSLPADNFISKAMDAGMFKSTFLGLSNILSIQKTVKKSHGATLIASSVTPDPEKNSLPLTKQYRDDMKKYLPNRQLSSYSFESYINTMLLYESIKKINEPLTTEKLITALADTKDLLGLKLSFDPATRTLSHQVWISDGSDKEWFLVNSKDLFHEKALVKTVVSENKTV